MKDDSVNLIHMYDFLISEMCSSEKLQIVMYVNYFLSMVRVFFFFFFYEANKLKGIKR